MNNQKDQIKNTPYLTLIYFLNIFHKFISHFQFNQYLNLFIIQNENTYYGMPFWLQMKWTMRNNRYYYRVVDMIFILFKVINSDFQWFAANRAVLSREIWETNECCTYSSSRCNETERDGATYHRIYYR